MSRKNEINPLVALILAGIGYRAYQQGRNPFFAILKAIFGFFFVILGAFAIIGLIASHNSPPVPVTPTAVGDGATMPSAATVFAPATPAIAAVPSPATSAIVAVDELGQMLSDSEILDASGAVIGRVHEGRPVHIVGATSAWLRIRKHDGQEGFIPAASADDVGAWVGSMPERAGSP